MELNFGTIELRKKINLGNVRMGIKKLYPELEDIEITPSTEEQTFIPKSYGFGKVYVKKVEGEELTITPRAEEQVKEGLFQKVTVKGDNNLVSENIKANTSIFGIEGSAQVVGEETEELLASYISSIDGSLGANVTRLPESITAIAKYAFYCCTNLALTELPESITTIDEYGFNRCTNLRLTKLPESLTTIGKHAFGVCTNLALTELPESLTTIDENAFTTCTNLALTKLPELLTTISNNAFYHCTNLALTELPIRVTNIIQQAFYGCTNLALTKLPEGLTSIGYQAFYGCKNLALTEIPEGVTVIQGNSFRNCTGLTSLNIKGQVTSIAAGAFSYSNLSKVIFPNITNVPTLANVSGFNGTPIANGEGYIYVPDELVDSVKVATNWSTYADQIKPISELEE